MTAPPPCDAVFANMDVRVAFDNYVVTQGQITCPDDDGDGYEAHLDCSDRDACSHTGAPEICDLRDNDCDGTIDEGETVAPGPVSRLALSRDTQAPSVALLSWVACGGRDFDVVKGDLAALRATGGDFTTSVTGCLENDSIDTSSSGPVQPGPGQGFYYIVRGNGTCGAGTYDGDGPAQVGSRDAETAASENACP